MDVLSNLHKVKSKQDPSAFATRGLSCFTGRRGRRGVDEAPQSFGCHPSGTARFRFGVGRIAQKQVLRGEFVQSGRFATFWGVGAARGLCVCV